MKCTHTLSYTPFLSICMQESIGPVLIVVKHKLTQIMFYLTDQNIKNSQVKNHCIPPTPTQESHLPQQTSWHVQTWFMIVIIINKNWIRHVYHLYFTHHRNHGIRDWLGKRVSELVFYAQSTSAVISGWWEKGVNTISNKLKCISIIYDPAINFTKHYNNTFCQGLQRTNWSAYIYISSYKLP